MKKRVNLGTSIVENLIIIVLVALTSIGILTTFGGTISETLGSCNIKFKEFQPFGESATALPSDEVGPGDTDDDQNIDPDDGGYNIPGIKPIAGGGDTDPIDDGVLIPTIDPAGSTAIVPIDNGINSDPTLLGESSLEAPIKPLDISTGPSDPGIGDTSYGQNAAGVAAGG